MRWANESRSAGTEENTPDADRGQNLFETPTPTKPGQWGCRSISFWTSSQIASRSTVKDRKAFDECREHSVGENVRFTLPLGSTSSDKGRAPARSGPARLEASLSPMSNARSQR